MAPAALLLLLLAPAGPTPRMVLEDPSACVDEQKLREALDELLPEDEAIARLALRVEVQAVDATRAIRVDLYPDELRPPVVHRVLTVSTGDCPSTPAAIAHIIARGLEGLPRTDWVRPVSRAAPLALAPVVTTPKARTLNLPPPLTYGSPALRLRLDGAFGFAGPFSPQLTASGAAAFGPAPWPRGLVTVDVSGNPWSQPLSVGGIHLLSVTTGVGVEAGTFPVWGSLEVTPQLLVSGGGLLGFGVGLEENRWDVLPAARVSTRLLIRSGATFLRLDVDGGLVRQRFKVEGLPRAYTEPAGRIGLLFGASYDLPLTER